MESTLDIFIVFIFFIDLFSIVIVFRDSGTLSNHKILRASVCHTSHITQSLILGFSKMYVTHHTISSTRIFQMYVTHFHNLGFTEMYVIHHHRISNTRIFQMYVTHFDYLERKTERKKDGEKEKQK
jgi:hypothetical protein